LDPKQQAWRFPVQQELEGLFGKLNAFNDRIAELAKDGHQSHAVNVLKAQALSLARHIDELRCFSCRTQTLAAFSAYAFRGYVQQKDFLLHPEKSEAGFCYVLLEERRDFLRQPVMCGGPCGFELQNAINFQLSSIDVRCLTALQVRRD